MHGRAMESPHDRSSRGAAREATTSTTTRLPSFVVTSSNDTTFARSSTPPRAGSTMTLNPDAQEFRVSSDFTGAFSAMPSAASALVAASAPQHQRWLSAALTEYLAPVTVANNGVSHHCGAPFPTASSTSADSDAMDSQQLVRLTEQYMHSLYDCKCRDEGLHMVSVFHLQPLTTNEDLNKIFFPTLASAAEVLDLRLMPAPLAKAFRASRQRAGVVFYSHRDCAMVGIEKMHDFVPHRQHQPLVVRYCGPDQHLASLSGASLPPRTDSGELQRGEGLSSATTVTPSPSRRTAQSRYREAASPCDGLFPGFVTAQPVSTGFKSVVCAGTSMLPVDGANSNTATYDLIDQYLLQKYACDGVYLVGVHNLARSTTTESLFKMFYPMGARSSELLPSSVSSGGKAQRSGVAFFDSKGMAMEAAAKMNNFVPVGQRRPVVARFLERTTPLADFSVPAVDSSTNSATVATASTPRGSRSSPRPASGVSAPRALIESIERQLQSTSLNHEQLAADMAALVLCAESGEAEARRVAAVLEDAFLSMLPDSCHLEMSLSAAFHSLHAMLDIPTVNAPATGVDTRLGVRKGEEFLKVIGHTLMLLVHNDKAGRHIRIVAARQCADFYRYTYMPKTPLCFAAMLFRKYEKEIMGAKGLRHRESDVTSNLAEEKQHCPWVTLVDALQEMVRVWFSLDRDAYTQDPSRDEYEHFIEKFYGLDVGGRNPESIFRGPAAAVFPGAAGEQQSGACTPRNGVADSSVEVVGRANFLKSQGITSASASAKESSLVTPSARPKPKGVISRSYSSTSDWKLKQSTPVAGHGRFMPPQVILVSPKSAETHGVSEFSTASQRTGGLMNSASRSSGITPPPPNVRISIESRFFSSERQSETASTPKASQFSTLPEALTLPASSSIAATGACATVSGGANAAPATLTERTEAMITEATVYITKLPSCLSTAQVKCLLLHFGDFRKVRLCQGDKETTRVGSAEALAAHNLKFNHLCFGFVEFVESSSAKAMVEFFRNEVHTAGAFDFLRAHEMLNFEDNQLSQLRNTRASQARNPIHEPHGFDATEARLCLFGTIWADITVDEFVKRSPEALNAVNKYLANGKKVPPPQQPMSAPSLTHPNLTSTPSSTWLSREVLYNSLETVGPGSQEVNNDDVDGGECHFDPTALQWTNALDALRSSASDISAMADSPMGHNPDAGRFHIAAFSCDDDFTGNFSCDSDACRPVVEDDDERDARGSPPPSVW